MIFVLIFNLILFGLTINYYYYFGPNIQSTCNTNLNPNTIDCAFWPNFESNTIDYEF